MAGGEHHLESPTTKNYYLERSSKIGKFFVSRQKKLRTTRRQMMRIIIGSHRRFPKMDDTHDENFDIKDNHEKYRKWITRETRIAERLMKEHDVKGWVERQSGRKWDWAGKTARRFDGRWSHEILKWHPNETKVRGKPRTRWSDTLNKFLTNHIGVPHTRSDWMKMASIPETWENLRDAFIGHDALRQQDSDFDPDDNFQ